VGAASRARNVIPHAHTKIGGFSTKRALQLHRNTELARAMNLIAQLRAALISDEGDPYEVTRRLTETYEEASEEGRAMLNGAFVDLCGYSLAELLNEPFDVA
jgi:hypothetical protein